MVYKLLGNRALGEPAFKVYVKMRELGYLPSEETYTVLFNACANTLKARPPPEGIEPKKVKVYERALSLLEHLVEKNNQVLRIEHLNAALTCCSRARDWEKLFELYNRLPLKVDAEATEEGSDELEELDAYQVEEEEEEEKNDDPLFSLKPTVVTFATMLSATARIGDVKGLRLSKKFGKH
jgi:hypothetical protein